MVHVQSQTDCVQHTHPITRSSPQKPRNLQDSAYPSPINKNVYLTTAHYILDFDGLQASLTMSPYQLLALRCNILIIAYSFKASVLVYTIS